MCTEKGATHHPEKGCCLWELRTAAGLGTGNTGDWTVSRLTSLRKTVYVSLCTSAYLLVANTQVFDSWYFPACESSARGLSRRAVAAADAQSRDTRAAWQGKL